LTFTDGQAPTVTRVKEVPEEAGVIMGMSSSGSRVPNLLTNSRDGTFAISKELGWSWLLKQYKLTMKPNKLGGGTNRSIGLDGRSNAEKAKAGKELVAVNHNRIY
jgi:hypothetical protein